MNSPHPHPHTSDAILFRLLQGLIILQQNLMTALEMEGDINLLLMTTVDYEQL